MEKKTLILEIADSAGNNETAKNAVDEECDKSTCLPVKKTSALLDVRYTSLRQPYDSYTSLTETSWLSPPLRPGIPEFLL